MKRRCPSCGEALAPNANFCRTCGTRYSPPAAAKPQAGPQPSAAARAPEPISRRGRVAIVIGAVILLIGAGVAVAILLGSGGGPSTTTVVQRTEAPAAERVADSEAKAGSSGPIEPGLYVQAGSFQTLVHAEAERERLAAQGVDVEVVSSDQAEELYPAFQVLLGGPIRSHAAQAGLLRDLHRNGVPSAFAREVTPATDGGGAPAAAGTWGGQLERTSSEDPKLNGPMPATLSLGPNGTTGSLDLTSIGCRSDLSLVSKASQVLGYSQEPACAGAGTVWIRPLEDELMLTLPSPSTNAFSLGTLDRD
jgi:zinc-ribbon domain